MPTPKLTEKQIQELDYAYNRPGGQTETDKTNINYALGLGYTPPEATTPAPIAPVAPTVPVTPPAPGDTGTPDTGVGSLEDIYENIGADVPEYQAPDTSAEDALIEQYQPTYDPAAIEKQLQTELSSIGEYYAILKGEAKETTENERQANISNLYGVGFVNPASSGIASIGSASAETLAKRERALRAEENAAKAMATDKAYGRKTEEREAALGFAQSERQRIEQEANDDYERQVQQGRDAMDMVTSAVNIWKSKKSVDRQDKIDAQDSTAYLIETFGSSAFDGVKGDDLTDIESASGFPEGSLTKGIEALKQAENAAEASEKNKFEMRTIGGSLYLIYPNQIDEKTGLPKKEMLISKSTSSSPSGPGSGNNNIPSAQSFEEWLGEKQERDLMTYNTANPEIRKALEDQYNKQSTETTSKITLSKTQYNDSVYNYQQATGKSEADFQKLSPSEQWTWYRYKPGESEVKDDTMSDDDFKQWAGIDEG